MKHNRTLLLVICCGLHFLSSFSQNTVGGRIIDEQTKEPMAFVNVVAQSLPDSAFIKGATTDEHGVFTLTDLPKCKLFIKISYVGYKTKEITNPMQELGDIKIEHDENMLQGITVKADVYSYDAEGVTARIQGTPLSKIGNASDVIRQLPFITTTRSDEIEVFGKGAPIYYVNHRRVRNNEEIKRINSANIKNIEIIVNPGSEYESSVNAVIKITTIRPKGEGLSGTLNATAYYRKKLYSTENVEINYRKNNLDIFAGVSHNMSEYKYKEEKTTAFNDIYIKTKGKYNDPGIYYTASSGFNYVIKDKHFIGMRYDLYYTPYNKELYGNSILEVFNNNVKRYEMDIDTKYHMKENVHMLNAYYNWTISSKSYLQFDADYMCSRPKVWQSSLHNYNDGKSEHLMNKTIPSKDMYATKAVYAFPFSQAKVKIGGEFIYTKTDNSNSIVGNVETPITNTKNVSKQTYWAAFGEYSRPMGKFSVNIGIRYELTHLNYFANGIKKEDACYTHNGFYPTVAVDYHTKNLYMSLAYRYNIDRPSYNNLSDLVFYNNPYSYTRGNSMLKDANEHYVTYTAKWKDLTFQTSYRYTKNYIGNVDEIYNGIDSIVVTRPINIKNRHKLSSAISYSLHIGIWNPRFEASVSKPFFKYNGISYNKPEYVLKYTNVLALPKGWHWTWLFIYSTKCNSEFSYYPENFISNMYVSKSFFKDKLRLNFNIRDVFYTNNGHSKKSVNDIATTAWKSNGLQSFQLSLTYSFNNTSSKYKGTGAGNSEKNR